MYDREYKGKTINFEASGGLINSSLVMQDFETDSYWAIMSGESIAGEFKGTKLVELPVSQKMQWRDWVKAHPNTLVLSVNGRQDGINPYERYFSSPEGFRGTAAKDTRLSTKEPVFAFRLDGKSYAVPLRTLEGGRALTIGKTKIFLYRPKGAEIFHSTLAFKTTGKRLEQVGGKWTEADSGCTFDPDTGSFAGKNACPVKLEGGFDTFWYNWSLANPDTELLK